MNTPEPRTPADVSAGICRMVRSLGRKVGQHDPADLRELVKISGEVQAALGVAVYALRDGGHTDKDIGEALGVSRAAVSQRWPGDGRYVGAAGRYRKPQESRR